MKVVLLVILGFTILFLSFQSQDKVGKAIFDHSCKSCHLPNRAVRITDSITAPSFQNIRKDYGLSWTVNFIQRNYRMHKIRDSRTLYSYYLFGKMQHVSFPQLEEKYIVKILDYVDSYPAYPAGYKHRAASNGEKAHFVKDQSLKDTVTQNVTIDTSHNVIDTFMDGRRSSRRSLNQQ